MLPLTTLLILAIDGLKPDCIWNATSTQGFEWLRQNSLYTLEARTAIETISAPGWTSHLCSLDSTETGVTTNEWVAPWWNTTAPPPDITPIASPFPCLFDQIKSQRPEVHISYYYDWDWLAFLGNLSYPGSVDDEFLCVGPVDDCDSAIYAKTMEWISRQQFNQTQLLFAYFNGVDAMGHDYGWCTEEYEEEVGVIDQYLQDIILALEPILNQSLLLLIADHGGNPGKTFHGSQNDACLFTPFFLSIPAWIPGNSVIDHPVLTLDTAPTVLNVLDLIPPDVWRGQPLLVS